MKNKITNSKTSFNESFSKVLLSQDTFSDKILKSIKKQYSGNADYEIIRVKLTLNSVKLNSDSIKKLNELTENLNKNIKKLKKDATVELIVSNNKKETLYSRLLIYDFTNKSFETINTDYVLEEKKKKEKGESKKLFKFKLRVFIYLVLQLFILGFILLLGIFDRYAEHFPIDFSLKLILLLVSVTSTMFIFKKRKWALYSSGITLGAFSLTTFIQTTIYADAFSALYYLIPLAFWFDIWRSFNK